jgi:hypothetical protein
MCYTKCSTLSCSTLCINFGISKAKLVTFKCLTAVKYVRYINFSVSNRTTCLLSLYSVPPVAVAAPPKVWVCGRQLPGIAGSNPVKGMDVCNL